jgi:hypothetical protein
MNMLAKMFRVALVPVAAAGLVLATVTAASAAPAVSYGNIRDYGSGKCLDVTNGSRSSGVTADQATCNTSVTSQFWAVIQQSTNYDTIKNQKSGLCLSTDRNGNAGVVVKQEGCDGSSKWQRWHIEALGGGFVTLWNEGSCGDCYALHPDGDSGSGGAVMYVNVPDTGNSYTWFGQVS